MTASRPPLHDSYESLLNRAQSLVRAGDIEGAILLYRRLISKLGRLSARILARRPELHEMHQLVRLELTGLLHGAGRYAEAIEVEEVLLTTHPDQADTWRTDLAILRISKGEVEAGLEELGALADKDPDNPARWLVIASETRISGRLSESEAALKRALEVADKDEPEAMAEIHYQRFLLRREMKQPDKAAAAWEEAARNDPQAGRTISEVYSMFTEIGRYSDAQSYIDRDENLLQAGYQRGLVASMTGNLTEATKQWQIVASLNPSEYEYGHAAWVESVLRLGDSEPALEWLQENLPRFGTPRLLVLSGIGWAMRGDQELASGLFQQAIALYRNVRPPKQKLDSADWRLLDSLVADDELKTTLKPNFAVLETLWG